MAWTTPRTWVTAELVTAALMNTHVRDNMRELWREIEVVTQTSTIGTPGNGGLYNINNGTVVASLSARTYPGVPIEIQFHFPYGGDSGTADLSSAIVVGLNDGTSPGVTPNVDIIGRATGFGNPPSSGGGGTGPWLSGVLSHRFTPSAAAHTYCVAIWSGNGEGADSAYIAGPSKIRLLERGG